MALVSIWQYLTKHEINCKQYALSLGVPVKFGLILNILNRVTYLWEILTKSIITLHKRTGAKNFHSPFCMPYKCNLPIPMAFEIVRYSRGNANPACDRHCCICTNCLSRSTAKRERNRVDETPFNYQKTLYQLPKQRLPRVSQRVWQSPLKIIVYRKFQCIWKHSLSPVWHYFIFRWTCLCF